MRIDRAKHLLIGSSHKIESSPACAAIKARTVFASPLNALRECQPKYFVKKLRFQD